MAAPMPGSRRWGRRGVALAAVAAVLLVPALAPATVEEQRARLPPPARCDDPVAGVWKSHQYSARFGDWYSFTLTIRRDPEEPGRLTGDMLAHSWTGGPAQEEPPPCTAGVSHWTVRMPAEGTVTPEGRIELHGTSWRMEDLYCGPPLQAGQYNLDSFAGVIDPELQEFQSLANDGGRAVNVPTVFRRIACGETPAAPRVNPVPPPFFPGRKAGCGC